MEEEKRYIEFENELESIYTWYQEGTFDVNLTWNIVEEDWWFYLDEDQEIDSWAVFLIFWIIYVAFIVWILFLSLYKILKNLVN